MDNLQYWHWFLVAAAFGLWSLLAGVSWLRGMCLGGLLVGLLAYLFAELHWGWQVWVFIMVSVLGAVVYLRREHAPGHHPDEDFSAERVRAAAAMAGKWAILQEDLPAGQGKIPIEGRFWQVQARVAMPAGSRVLVTGHEGAVLRLRQQGATVEADFDEDAPPAVQEGEVSLPQYQRSAEADMLFGSPDMDYWVLFREAQEEHSKLALVYAYHLICHQRGIDLEQARKTLNTYTLALYDSDRPGQLMALQPRLYSDPKTYAFLYGEKRWRGRQLDRFNREMDALDAALDSHWADIMRDAVPSEQLHRAVADIRLRQVSVR